MTNASPADSSEALGSVLAQLGGGRAAPSARSTADRLLDAGLTLFAEQGFRATTVGQIEQLAGFAPRGGTLYKHFESKRALLEAALQRHVESIARFDDVLRLLPLTDLRSELLLLARWMLAELDREKAISLVIEKNGADVPDLVEAMRVGVMERGYEFAIRYLEQRFPDLPGYADSDRDREATAVLMIGSLVNVRRAAWTYGKPPLGIDDDRAINAWVNVVTTLLEHSGAAAT
ncbi:TetR/AcrR family transcriptional regulator [Desertimonas flava]|uniref:TetR/AcrR family transcriptional regulator n=1 Tax=Desertimonas flava TaxID=2064846 RepID=UPI000E342ED2|nr:TetR/AcrR family transcriptional regulator [Desertimonas flava]